MRMGVWSGVSYGTAQDRATGGPRRGTVYGGRSGCVSLAFCAVGT